jgi:hypothetical protein
MGLGSRFGVDLFVQRFLERMVVQEGEGIHCLVLGQVGHVEVNGRIIEIQRRAGKTLTSRTAGLATGKFA